MSKTAKQFLGDLGTMKGDVEVAIFKQLRARGVNKANYGGTIVEVGTNIHGARTVEEPSLTLIKTDFGSSTISSIRE